MATLADLLAQARIDLDDPEFPGSGDDSNSLWSDAELTGYINRAIDEACLRARLIRDSSSQMTKIPVQTGTHTYKLDYRIYQILRAKIASDTKPLCRSGYKNLDTLEPAWETRTGVPREYIEDMDSQRIRLIPTPEADDTLELVVQRTHKRPLVAGDNCPVIPELPLRVHYDVLDYAYYLALRKQDDDTNSLARATFFLNKFTDTFGERPEESEIEYYRQREPTHVRAHFL